MKIFNRNVTLKKLRHLPSYWSWYRFEQRNKREHVINRAFDVRFGTETAAEMWLTAAGVDPAEVERGNAQYRPTWEAPFHRILRALAIDHERFTFIDYGSGKGKVMLMASDYPFAEIIGVEYAPKLHEIASRNCGTYRSPHQRCQRLRPMLADATIFEPPATPIVCFFFNPFDGKTLQAVLDTLGRSIERHPREMYMIYVNHRSVRERSDISSVLDRPSSLRLVRGSRTTLIYRTAPV